MSEVKAAPQKTEKMVKIRTLRSILVNRTPDKMGILGGEIIPPGKEIEVTEAGGPLFCDTKFSGHYSFSGERKNDRRQHDYRRAERVMRMVPA